jgi:hypothetical protein
LADSLSEPSRGGMASRRMVGSRVQGLAFGPPGLVATPMSAGFAAIRLQQPVMKDFFGFS